MDENYNFNPEQLINHVYGIVFQGGFGKQVMEEKTFKNFTTGLTDRG